MAMLYFLTKFFMKRVYIIHGWGGRPDKDWLGWLGSELEKKNFKVYIPKMPNTWVPRISEWISKIESIVEEPDRNTYFVGHSIGCQAIMRYLEKLPGEIKIGGSIFVAGWLNLNDETWDETYTKEIADEWLNTPIDFNKIKKHSERFLVINSDNDPYVPLDDVKLFKKNLDSKIIIEKNKGHISGEDGVTELPVVLEELLKISR